MSVMVIPGDSGALVTAKKSARSVNMFESALACISCHSNLWERTGILPVREADAKGAIFQLVLHNLL